MSSSKKSFEPPLKRAALSSPSPTKLPEWYQKYSQEAFVHDNEFDETKIHSESYDTKIKHLQGKKASKLTLCQNLRKIRESLLTF